MKVIVISKTPFDVATFVNVSSISFADDTYTIVTDTTTVTYSANNFIVRVV